MTEHIQTMPLSCDYGMPMTIGSLLDLMQSKCKTAQRCQYCGSTVDDSRGNCGACGAPREEHNENYSEIAREWGLLSKAEEK